MSQIGVIAIGRNEGQRLRRCLESVVGRQMTVVYVDSNSSDGSRELAAGLGAEVVALDMTLPFSAARARNSGVQRLITLAPEVRFLQFVDGDCEMVAGWTDAARAFLETHADVAVVCGRRRERFPEHSIYNRLADVEWNTPIGPANSCGGDSMMRRDAFDAVDGFDPSVTAGEEPELCQRLRGAGWKVMRIDAEMTLHDSAILHYGQWWRRQIRGGYGAMDVAARFGDRGLFVGQVRSARRWGIGWPAIVFVATVGSALGFALAVDIRRAALAALLAFVVTAALLPLQMLRLARKTRSRAGTWRVALAYGCLTMFAKWANLSGQSSYARDRRAGVAPRLIEYKSADARPGSPQ